MRRSESCATGLGRAQLAGKSQSGRLVLLPRASLRTSELADTAISASERGPFFSNLRAPSSRILRLPVRTATALTQSRPWISRTARSSFLAVSSQCRRPARRPQMSAGMAADPLETTDCRASLPCRSASSCCARCPLVRNRSSVAAAIGSRTRGRAPCIRD
jgi:hypothetical protein